MVDQMTTVDSQCPSWAAALGYMGVASAVCLSNWGAAVSRGSWDVVGESTSMVMVRTPGDWQCQIMVQRREQLAKGSEILLGSKKSETMAFGLISSLEYSPCISSFFTIIIVGNMEVGY
jgi:hypothetical protein